MLDKVTRAGDRLELAGAPGPIAAKLHFARGGGRTVLTGQRVPYPFHVTRPFYLDKERPDLATLYLQSASGGLYRGDRVSLSIAADAHAAVHVTTQASTIVHRTDRRTVEQHTSIAVGDNAFVAVTPDPLVLFPGAAISCVTEVTLAATGVAILTEGFARHDPDGLQRPFDRYSGAVIVRDKNGAVLLHDRGSVAGEQTYSAASPLGPFGAAATLLVLGRRASSVDVETLEARLSALGCVAGISNLPNAAGIGGRIVAADGGTLARGLEAAFAGAFAAVVGTPPARRRK